jgi:hypothetical protein
MKKIFSVMGLGIVGVWVFFVVFGWLQVKGEPASKMFNIMFLGDSLISYVAQPKGGCFDRGAFVEVLDDVMNTYAELDGIKTRFKVEFRCKAAQPVLNWPYYEVPMMTKRKKYDATILVISAAMTDSDHPFYYPWFYMPVSKNGMPAHELDREYLLKDARERIPAGVAGDFYKRCVGKNLAGIKSGKFWFGRFREMLQDEAIEKDLIEMFSIPIGLLKEKIENKTMFYLMFLPCPAEKKHDAQALFWKKVSRKTGVKIIDLTPEFRSLRPSFVPLTEKGGYYHMDRCGHIFTTFVLMNKFRDTGVVPWN